MDYQKFESVDDLFERFGLCSTSGIEPTSDSRPRPLMSVEPDRDRDKTKIEILTEECEPCTELKYADLFFCKILGRGNFATVRHAVLGRPYLGHTDVAVKKVTNLNREEINILKKFKNDPHPNILQFLEYIERENEHLIITELATRGSLYQFLSKNLEDTLPLFVVQKWVADLAAGVKFLHDRNVVHRDIKSPNCLLFEHCTLKMCDLGIARESENSLTTMSLKGSFRWLSPEVLGTLKYSKRSDIYAFGMVALEIYTRKVPFFNHIERHIMIRDENKQPDIPTHCPQFLRQLMLQCWQGDPQKRPAIDCIVEQLQRKFSESRSQRKLREWEQEHFQSNSDLAIASLKSNANRTEQNEAIKVMEYAERETALFVESTYGAHMAANTVTDEAISAKVDVPLNTVPKVTPGPATPKRDCTLSNYISDLHIEISKDGFSAKPLTEGGFAYLWAGAKATHGIRAGKGCFEIKLTGNLDVQHLPAEELDHHVVRVGWSTSDTSLHLGSTQFSYGYGGKGMKCSWGVYRPYADKVTFEIRDVIGSYLDFTGDKPVISYTKNGDDLGVAFTITSNLEGHALFPHVYLKNTAIEINLGQKRPYFPLKDGYTYLRNLSKQDCVAGPCSPASKGDCEVLMMVGLPGSGKSTWADKHCQENPAKKFVILGTNQIMDDMKVTGLLRTGNYVKRFERLHEMTEECHKRLLEIALCRKHNYILDQTNVYQSARKRKILLFEDFTCKAIVVVPSLDVFKTRVEEQKKNGKIIPDEEMTRMIRNFRLPEVGREIGPLFSEVQYVELQREEAAAALVNDYK